MMAVYPFTQKLISSTATISRERIGLLRWVLAPVLGIVLLAAWIIVVEAEVYPAFILPHPADVLSRLATQHERGQLWPHVWITFREAITGLAIAGSLALPLGYAVARNRWISAMIVPYLVAVRAIPLVAIAAIIVIWLGAGIESKVFVVAFITWFPLMEATVIGLQGVDSQLQDLMRSYQAKPIQRFLKLELPSAMPNLLGGLKISATLAVVGAAVAEIFGANKGLAYLIMFGRGTSDTPLVFGAVILLTSISLVFYGIVAILEHFLLAWRRIE